jgi:hypothetical protein
LIRRHVDVSIFRAKLPLELKGVGLGNKRSDLDGIERDGPASRLLLENFNLDRDDARADHIQDPGGRVRQVDNPVSDEWTAVVDPDNGGPSVIEVCDHDLGSEGKSLVRGRHLVHVVNFLVRRRLAVKIGAVPRG